MLVRLSKLQHRYFWSLALLLISQCCYANWDYLPKIKSNYYPRATLNAQAGSFGLAQIDYLSPVLGNQDNLTFFDIRYMAKTTNALELNVGLGQRIFLPKMHSIWGGFLWMDRVRTVNKNYFSQATIGTEWLQENMDARLNIYLPYGRKSITQYGISPFITGHTIGIVEEGETEKALAGGDIEIGHAMPYIKNLRGFIDYYHFGTQSDPQMNGGRARIEYHFSPQVIFTAAYSYDNLRQGIGLIGLRLSMGGVNPTVHSLRSRMEDFVIRDIDLITSSKSQPPTRITDPKRYWFVNNTASGAADGTYEHPYPAVDTAVGAAQDNDVLYVYKGSGVYPLPTGGTNLKANQYLITSGAPLLFRGYTILPATGQPTLNGLINVADGNHLSNFIMDGSGSEDAVAISGDSVTDIVLNQIAITNYTGNPSLGVDSSGTSTQTGGNGGIASEAMGIIFQNSSQITINNVSVSNINGGAANGGSGQSTDGGGFNTNAGNGGAGGSGGDAIGIMLDNTTVAMNNVTVNGIHGGAANGGDGSSANPSGSAQSATATGGSAGTGGDATGIYTNNSSGTLQHVSVINIAGGNANGGAAILTGTVLTPGLSSTFSGGGGSGGNAEGILLSNSAHTLNHVSIQQITGGQANAAVSDSNVAGTATASAGGTGGNAEGLNAVLSNINLSTLIINNVTAGNANGGNAMTAAGGSGFGGDGGSGGNSVGLNISSATVPVSDNVTIQAVKGGDADAGEGDTADGFSGTPGSAVDTET